MANFNPIDAWNGKLKFKDAFKLDAAGILKFLKGVVDKPSDYGASSDHQSDLKLLYEKLDLLKPKNLGNTSGWSPQKWREEKSKIQQILRSGNTLTPTKKIKWTANDKSHEFFEIFDILGAFISLVGPAPAGATPTNFYLPFVVVYAKWITALSQFPYWRPAVAQITWVSKDEGKTWYYFLGASLGGVSGLRELAGKKRHEYQRLSGVLKAPYTTFGRSIMLDKSAQGTNFGNCGETYPFLYALADRNLKGDSYGIALHIPKIDSQTEYVGNTYWNQDTYWSPCGNCKQLQRWYGLPDYLLVNGVL